MKSLELNAVEIKRLTGRKSPLTLMDSAEIDDDSLTGLASVTMSQSFFQGHFPGNPVMPGVLIIETMEQTCEVMFKHKHPDLKLSQIKKARFREMVKPGDQLEIKINRIDKDEFCFKTEAYLKDTLACSAELTFAAVK